MADSSPLKSSITRVTSSHCGAEGFRNSTGTSSCAMQDRAFDLTQSRQQLSNERDAVFDICKTRGSNTACNRAVNPRDPTAASTPEPQVAKNSSIASSVA